MSAIPPLFVRLFDDASLFPPAELPMDDALRAHAMHGLAWYAELVGPFACPSARIRELRTGLEETGTERLAIALIVPGGPDAVPDAVAALRADPHLHAATVEVATPGGATVKDAVEALDAHLPDGAIGYAEIPREAIEGSVAALAGTPHRAKLRTGGTVAAAFPGEDEVGAALGACARAHVALKCTAGLHNAVRHTARATGFEHHGFLNVLLATATALEDEDARATLSERDAGALAARAAELSPEQVAAVRTLLVSIGSCSIDEPLDDLASLGLVRAP